MTLRKAIADAINRNSAENGSDTPDFILAKFLTDCLTAFDNASNWRTAWYSPDGVDPQDQADGPGPHQLEVEPPPPVQVSAPMPDPPPVPAVTPDTTGLERNLVRGRRAKAALVYYKQYQLKEGGVAGPDTLIDLLTDIRHLVKTQSRGSQSFETMIRISGNHFKAETQG